MHTHESKILWLDETARQRSWVREGTILSRRRTGGLGKKAHWTSTSQPIVAIAELSAEARSCNGYFTRRVWYVDLTLDGKYSQGRRPVEAVHPSLVMAGETKDEFEQGWLDKESAPPDDSEDLLPGIRLVRPS